MKKKLAIAASVLITLGSLQVAAQSKKTNTETKTTLTSIKTPNDTLAYAFGANMVQQGLKQYLGQLGIEGNEEKMNIFLKGFNEGLTAKGENTAYVTGLGVGDQMFKMATEFSKQAFEDGSVDNMNIDLVAKGISDALSDKTPMIENVEAIMNRAMAEGNKRKEEENKKANAAVIEKGEKFMAENKTIDGVVTLPSGLQYKIVVKGSGDTPTENDNVRVHYKGTLTDGTEFDNSYDRGEPLMLGVNQVIKGWTEALQLMPVGSKWMLYVPYDLAYGERGTGAIPAYSNLIFEIDLVSIDK